MDQGVGGLRDSGGGLVHERGAYGLTVTSGFPDIYGFTVINGPFKLINGPFNTCIDATLAICSDATLAICRSSPYPQSGG